jgi:hypothetical protein
VTTVIVTWMDGKQETYRAEDVRTHDGQLHVFTKNQSALGSREAYHLPLASIRVWKEEQ